MGSASEGVVWNRFSLGSDEELVCVLLKMWLGWKASLLY